MTNEEAIKILEFMKSEMFLSFDHDRKEALSLAISALQTQELNNSNQEVKKSNDLTLANSLPTCNNLQQVATDTISRQAAIDGLEGYIDDKGIFNQDRWFVHGIKTAITHLKRMPSAQPERKRGKWIEKPVKEYCSRDCWYPPTNKWDTWNEEEGYWLEDEIFCSECNYHDWQRLKTKFCPNCGAKMEGEG